VPRVARNCSPGSAHMLHKWLRFGCGSAASQDDLDSSSLCLFLRIEPYSARDFQLGHRALHLGIVQKNISLS